MTSNKSLNKVFNFLKNNKDNSKKDLSSIGAEAEALSEKFLKKNGLKLIERNFNCRLGEIDRIMQHGDTLVFVEVRLRQHQQVSAAETVNIHKQRRLIKAAKYFLLNNNHYQDYPCRFDVIALDGLHESRIDWIKDAFQLQE